MSFSFGQFYLLSSIHKKSGSPFDRSGKVADNQNDLVLSLGYPATHVDGRINVQVLFLQLLGFLR